jgi:hypothetical protein
MEQCLLKLSDSVAIRRVAIPTTHPRLPHEALGPPARELSATEQSRHRANLRNARPASIWQWRERAIRFPRRGPLRTSWRAAGEPSTSLTIGDNRLITGDPELPAKHDAFMIGSTKAWHNPAENLIHRLAGERTRDQTGQLASATIGTPTLSRSAATAGVPRSISMRPLK